MVWGQLSNGNKWTIRTNDGGELRVEVAGGFHYGTTVLTDDEWHHVAVVLEDDGSPDVQETLLYVDGVSETTGASADEPINTIADFDLHIGFDPMPGGENRSFLGLMDDVRIYDQALSQEQIAKLAQPG